VKCYIWSIALYVADIWKLWTGDKKYLEIVKMWWWLRWDDVSWYARVRNAEVLHIVKEERNYSTHNKKKED
jgi:hypothetical protein